MTLFWKTFSVLLSAGLLGTLAVTPLLLSIYAPFLETNQVAPATFILGQIIQVGVLLSLSIYSGLKLGQQVQLKAHDIQVFLENKAFPKKFSQVLLKAAAWGVAVGLAIILLDLVFLWAGTSLAADGLPAPLWQRLLASFYGGITEELLLRFGVMTLVVYLLAKISRKALTQIPNWVYWSGIVFTAIIFGALHLPVTSALTELTPLIVIRGLLLNGIGGVIFGWLFWKKGLFAAITAHFTADIVLQLISPLL